MFPLSLMSPVCFTFSSRSPAFTIAHQYSRTTELESEPVGEDTISHRQCYLQKAPARQLPKINCVPLLQLTGEASVHVTYDHCLIEFLKQAGGSPEWIQLADIGIKGNGHFMHVEKNNLEVADVVKKWIEKRSGSA